ncbi:MAG: PAS domain S-box protein [Hyphomicrobiaceae bacterium]
MDLEDGRTGRSRQGGAHCRFRRPTCAARTRGARDTASAVIVAMGGRTADEIKRDQGLARLLGKLEATSRTSIALAIIRADTGQPVAVSAAPEQTNIDWLSREPVEHTNRSGLSSVGSPIVSSNPSKVLGFTLSHYDPGSGLAVVSVVGREEFQRHYSQQITAASDVIMLVRRDGVVLARTPEYDEAGPESRVPIGAAIMKLAASREQVSDGLLTSDGIVRHAVVRHLSGYPIFAVYGQATSTLLTDWLRRLVPLGLITLLATLLIRQMARRIEATTAEAVAARGETSAQKAIMVAREAADSARRESFAASERLAAIVATSADAILTKRIDGAITSWNAGAEKLFGYAREDIIGKPARVLYPSHLVEEEDDILARLSRGESIDHYETTRLHKDGRSIDVSVSISPLRNEDGSIFGASAILRDVSARKRAEARLSRREAEVRESERRFRNVFDNAGTGIAITDFEGQIEQCNPAYADMLGFKVDELMQRKLSSVLHPEDRPAELAQHDSITRGELETYEVENRSIRKDGELVWLHKHVSLLRDSDDTPNRLVTLVTDMTENRRARERQHVLMRELAHRGKNLLAVIQSIASRSLSGDSTLEEARKAFQGRVQALARTYGSLTDEAFSGVSLAELINGEMSAFPNRASLDGPEIRLTARAAQTFSLIIHELATNAVKYGALSTASGLVDIRWKIVEHSKESPNADLRRFAFEWRERSGPHCNPPNRRGFGTTLVTTVAGSEFRCKPEIAYLSGGLSYRLDAPLKSIGTFVRKTAFRSRLKHPSLQGLYDLWHDRRQDPTQFPVLDAETKEKIDKSEHLTHVEILPGDDFNVVAIGKALLEKLETSAEDFDDGSDHPENFVESYRSVPARDNHRMSLPTTILGMVSL